MNESKSKMEPWQLLLIVVLVLSFFGGGYVLQQAIGVKLDSLETTIAGKTDSIKIAIERLENKFDVVKAAHKAALVVPAVPAPVAAPPAAEGDEAAPAEGKAE